MMITRWVDDDTLLLHVFILSFTVLTDEINTPRDGNICARHSIQMSDKRVEEEFLFIELDEIKVTFQPRFRFSKISRHDATRQINDNDMKFVS